MNKDSQKNFVSEFDAPRWSVISSDERAASGLSYLQAVKLVREMSGLASGLCIVTDEAADRILRSEGVRQMPDQHSEDAIKHFTETL